MTDTPTVTYTTKITQPAYAVTYTKPTRFMVNFPHTKDNITVTVNGETRRDYEYANSSITFAPRVLSNGDEVTISRQTLIEAPEPTVNTLAEFHPGAPIKGNDLNENYNLLVKKVEELEALARLQSFVSSAPPPDYLIQTGTKWVSTQTWKESVYNGTQWVELSPQSAIQPEVT